MEILDQIIVLLCLIFGIIIGEYLASRAFGRPKKTVLALLEIIVFVILLVVITNSIYVLQFDTALLAGINFVVGFMVVIISRGLSTGAGYISEMPRKLPFQKYTKEEKLMINTTEKLIKRGFSANEVRKTLISSGYTKKQIDEAFRIHKFAVGTVSKPKSRTKKKLKKTRKARRKPRR